MSSRHITAKITKLLIANRGEIAIRIAHACTELGILTVSVYADDNDKHHTFFTDEYVRLDDGSAGFMNPQGIIEVAKRTGATAIHPGYGFLSESAKFAAMCLEEGILFIGPKPNVIDQLGDKIAARKMAQAAGLPVIPGTDIPVKDEHEVAKFAAKHGYPIMIKARDGGGGRGIRMVRNDKEITNALARCKGESNSGEVFLEKVIENAKHVEVQIMGDLHGEVVHLYERDCSIQRRFQKIVEIAPSPYLPYSLLSRLHTSSLTLARHLHYTSVGTIEYLIPQTSNMSTFYFLEVNPRLQVEHPITEQITSIDLVKTQLLLSMGHSLSRDLHITQQTIKSHGYAVQCRLIAECPSRNFSPSLGKISHLSLPTGGTPGLRIDTWLRPGAIVTPLYDSLLAKIIVWDIGWEAVLARTRRVLGEVVVEGVETNRDVLIRILERPEIAQLVPDQWVGVTWLENNLKDLVAVSSLELKRERIVGNLKKELPKETNTGSVGVVFKPGDAFQVILMEKKKPKVASTVKVTRVQQNAFPQRFQGTIEYNDDTYDLTVQSAMTAATSGGTVRKLATTPTDVPSPIMGQIVEVLVKPGEEVEEGKEVFVVSAMKMETVVRCPLKGRVKSVEAKVGDIVGEGEVIIILEDRIEAKSKL